MLPNFLIIGAQKCGTTSICAALERHPDIFVSKPRETRFFVDDVQWAFGAQNYETQSFGNWDGQTAVGEKTPEYLLFDTAPERVRQVLGNDVRLIVGLRNPAQRAFSHFRHNLMMRVERLGFDEALAAEEQRTSGSWARTALFGYRLRGQYARQLKPWLTTFSSQNFLFLKFEQDIVGDAAAAATPPRLFQFLGVSAEGISYPLPAEGRPPLPQWRIGDDEVTIAFPPHEQIVKAPSAFLRDFAQQARQITPTVHRLDAAQATEMNNRLWRNEIEEASQLTGLDLSDWLS